MKESACYEVKGSSDDTDDKAKTDGFSAFLVQRDPRHADRAIVLAGFDDHMRLIVPKEDVSITIDTAKSVAAHPVEFSKQIQPFIQQKLEQVRDRLPTSRFLERLNLPPHSYVVLED